MALALIPTAERRATLTLARIPAHFTNKSFISVLIQFSASLRSAINVLVQTFANCRSRGQGALSCAIRSGPMFSSLALIAVLLTGCGPALPDAAPQPNSAMGDRDAALHSQISVSPSSTAPLQTRIAAVLERNLQARRLDSQVNAAWQIMHGVICYGAQLLIDTPDRGLVSATQYAFTGGQLMGFELMEGNEPLPLTGRVGLKAR